MKIYAPILVFLATYFIGGLLVDDKDDPFWLFAAVNVAIFLVLAAVAYLIARAWNRRRPSESATIRWDAE